MLLHHAREIESTIAEFPEFVPLTLHHQLELEAVTSKYPPYSDFNFISMYSWDVEGNIRLARIGENIVIRFADYVTSEPFFMFIGEGCANTSARALLCAAAGFSVRPSLGLIPGSIAARLNVASFLVEKQPEQMDYIVSTRRLLGYEGKALALQRNFVRRFLQRHGNLSFTSIDLHDAGIRIQVAALCERWHAQKYGATPDAEKHELIAIERCVGAFQSQLLATGLYDGDRLVAFWLGESVGGHCAISHFEKAETSSYVGITPYLRQRTAELLIANRIEYLNLEQDLGIAGLRQSKRSYAPIAFLHKYGVTIKS